MALFLGMMAQTYRFRHVWHEVNLAKFGISVDKIFKKIAFPLFMSLMVLIPLLIAIVFGIDDGMSSSSFLLLPSLLLGLTAHISSNRWVTLHPDTEFGKGVLGGGKGKVTGQPLLPSIIYPYQHSFYPKVSYAYGPSTRKEFEHLLLDFQILRERAVRKKGEESDRAIRMAIHVFASRLGLLSRGALSRLDLSSDDRGQVRSFVIALLSRVERDILNSLAQDEDFYICLGNTLLTNQFDPEHGGPSEFIEYFARALGLTLVYIGPRPIWVTKEEASTYAISSESDREKLSALLVDGMILSRPRRIERDSPKTPSQDSQIPLTNGISAIPG
ncbi:MAG: hypothetical protein HYZ84_01960, partial [Candidatus Omnitrophica bacterium]|nr:hypothetical protein [Candidatus Omnitrophota bacterium]